MKRTPNPFEEPLSAALRSHSDFIDSFVDDIPEHRPVPAAGWTSYLSPSYWARVAEETLRKLIDKHLLQPPDDVADVPSPHFLSAPSLSSTLPAESMSLPIPSSGYHPRMPLSAHSPSRSPSHSPSPSHSSSDGNRLMRSASLASSLSASSSSQQTSRLHQTRNLRVGTSWTRLGPFFASSSRHLVSSANPADTDSQISDSSSVLTTETNTSDDLSSTPDDCLDIETYPPFSSLEISPPPLPQSASMRRSKRLAILKRRAKPALALQMAACTMSDPRKGRKGGEDAFFISAKRNACGVADGVGAWLEQGVDAGAYSRRLVKLIKRACERRKLLDPSELLEFAYKKITNESVPGSTTICLLTLNPISHVVHTSNLGDSGFLVIRDNQLILRSSPQQHGINHPYQIGANRDIPADADTIMFTGHPGDLIVMGTDGLFDNLHIDEILTFVQTLTAKQLKENLQPQSNSNFAQELAELLLNAAVEASADPEKYCPFNATNTHQPIGGKLDDITVLVAQIVNNNP